MRPFQMNHADQGVSLCTQQALLPLAECLNRLVGVQQGTHSSMIDCGESREVEKMKLKKLQPTLGRTASLCSSLGYRKQDTWSFLGNPGHGRGLRAYVKSDSREGTLFMHVWCHTVLATQKNSLESGNSHLTDRKTEAKSLSTQSLLLCPWTSLGSLFCTCRWENSLSSHQRKGPSPRDAQQLISTQCHGLPSPDPDSPMNPGLGDSRQIWN